MTYANYRANYRANSALTAARALSPYVSRGSERSERMNSSIYAIFRLMDDADLAERIERLQRKCEELKQSTTLIGQRMAEQYGEALQAALAEQRRRTC
jgi:hypothetical protein